MVFIVPGLRKWLVGRDGCLCSREKANTDRVSAGEDLDSNLSKESMRVVALGPFPPPVHGAALANEALVVAIEANCPTLRVSTSAAPVRLRMSSHVAKGVRLARAARKALRSWRGSPSKVLLVSVAGGLGNIYSIVFVAMAALASASVVFDHHSYAYLRRRSTLVSVMFWLAGKRARHLTLTHDMESRLIGLYAARNTVCISNAGRMRFDRKERVTGRKGRLNLGHISNLSPEKGVELVIDTFMKSRNAGIDCALHLAGPIAGPSRVKDEIEKAKRSWPDTFFYYGPLFGVEKARFYEGLDVFLFPSRYKNEAEPLVCLEALAASIPVLGSSVGSLTELLGPEFATRVGSGTEYCDWALEIIARFDKDRDFLEAQQQAALNRFRERAARAAVIFEETVASICSPKATDGRNR